MTWGHKTGGRQKGTPNKFTSNVKDAFSEAFEMLGGAQALYKWAQRNQTDFYKLASKLIPADLNVGIVETPEARVYPMGLPNETELPSSSEAVDRIH